MPQPTRVVRLLSNAAPSPKVLPGVNDPAEFVTDLPISIARAGKRWDVNLESITFRTVFGNVQHLEEYGSHLIAWPCKDFMSSTQCKTYDRSCPETFPSRDALESAYCLRESRLNESLRYGDMATLARSLTRLLDSGNVDSTATTTTTTGSEKPPSRRNIEFSVGSGGELRIEGDGEVVLLLSRNFADWIGMTDRHGPMVYFGRRHNPHFRLLDFSKGLMTDGKRPWLQGTVRDPLSTSRVEPSRIHIMVSFNGDYWREKCLRIVPWQDRGAPRGSSGDQPEHYFYKSFDGREPTRIPLSEDVRQVKIRLVDQLGRTLRLVSNLEHPTVATLTFRPIATDMSPHTIETSICQSPNMTLMHFFRPPLDNSDGTWQAGLRGIFIPSDIDWVEDNDLDYQILVEVDGQEGGMLIDPPPGRAFRSPRTLIASLGDILKREACGIVELQVKRDGRVALNVRDGARLTMWRKFTAVLGLDNVDSVNDRVVLRGVTTGNRRVDVTRVFPACIAVHCDIVRPTVFGSGMKHVLAVIPTSSRCGAAGTGTIYYQARKPLYTDVTASHLSNYRITLTSVPDGREIRFRDGAPDLFAQVSLKRKDR